eukprot:365092-Chlamydomonas_euryale.AAC.6
MRRKTWPAAPPCPGGPAQEGGRSGLVDVWRPTNNLTEAKPGQWLLHVLEDKGRGMEGGGGGGRGKGRSDLIRSEVVVSQWPLCV